MQNLNKALDENLLDLAWSLWTEVGVAGVKRKHQKCLIFLEELILLTVMLTEIDPRLRDESLDWCSRYHHFISVSRLKLLIKSFDNLLEIPFSNYVTLLNSVTRTGWPVFFKSPPFKVVLSHKSKLRSLDSPALLNLRVRALFGTGARADLVTFFLMNSQTDFSASDLVKIGYSKRNLAEILEEMCLSGLFNKFLIRNQLRYRLNNSESLIKVLGTIPSPTPSWRKILEVLLPLRELLKKVESFSQSSQVVEIRNFLITHQNNLQQLNQTPPTLEMNYSTYLNSFRKWLLEFTQKLANGEFP